MSNQDQDVTLVSVRVRDIPDDCNPTPIMDSDEAIPTDEREIEEMFELNLTEENLREYTHESDLLNVNRLEIKFDTFEQAIDNIGLLLPNLRELKLSRSVIGSIRDLGIGLVNLHILWVDRCGLTSLDGIVALPELKELYASFNDIIELSPLALHDKIELIDLDSNGVKDINEVLQLISCNSLQCLNLDGNPVTSTPNYRSLIVNYVNQLQVLDDIDITDEERENHSNLIPDIIRIPTETSNNNNNNENNSNNSNNSSENNNKLDEKVEEEIMIAEGIKQCLPSSMKSKHILMGSPSKRAQHKEEHMKEIYERPRTALGLEQLSINNHDYNNNSNNNKYQHSRDPTTGSDLTHGMDCTIVGNPVMGLRKRRATTPSVIPTAPSTINTDRASLLAELKAFKIESNIFNDLPLPIVNEDDDLGNNNNNNNNNITTKVISPHRPRTAGAGSKMRDIMKLRAMRSNVDEEVK